MIDPIFNLFKVKFVTLDNLNLLDKSKKKAVIYIDLEIVMKYLYTRRVNEYLIGGDKKDVQISLMSNIVNLAQHYRLYCTKYKMDNEVILYWNYPKGNGYKNSIYNQNYRNYYDNKLYNRDTCRYLRDRMDAIQDFLNIMIKYVNQVYLVSTSEIESSLIPYILLKNRYQDQEIQHIIVTDDKYGFQYVNKGFTILVPDKENSVILNRNNIIQYLKDSQDVKSNDMVTVNYVPFLISLLGNKYRNLEKIKGLGISSLMRLIQKGISDFIVTPNTTSIDMLKMILPEKDREVFCDNYHCTDLDLQYQDLEELEIRKILNGLIDKFDDNSMAEINDRYFKTHPLMMINTVREQILNERNNRKSIFE